MSKIVLANGFFLLFLEVKFLVALAQMFTTLNKFAVNVKFKKNVTTLLTNTIV